MGENVVCLNGDKLNFPAIRLIAAGCSVQIDPECEARVRRSWDLVHSLSESDHPVYGINTGFGFLANRKIPPDQQNQLQINLLRSHAAGYGAPLSPEVSRIAMALRLNVLLKGFSGVRFELCVLLCAMLNHRIYPIIPAYGSVGASGDLAPLAHLALPLIGEGDVLFNGVQMPASRALEQAGLKPYILSKKEGLGLINGTQIMLAVGILPFLDAQFLLEAANTITALSFEALEGNPVSLDLKIHRARGQPGQMACAQQILAELEGSYLHDPQLKRAKVQDPYSLRCAPQVHGPTQDCLNFVGGILLNELNAATDNPLVFTENREVLSGGNFHGQYLAAGFDMASIAMAEIGSISERRLELLLNPHLSGLPAFLAPNQGIQSGYMAAQYLSASLVNESKHLANPACTDSIPGNVGIEDHVSMGMTSARKFGKLIDHLWAILAIEMVASAQAIDLRQPAALGSGTKKLYESIRERIPPLKEDRIVSEDIRKGVELLQHIQSERTFSTARSGHDSLNRI